MGQPEMDELCAGLFDSSRLFGARRRRRAATTLAARPEPGALAALAEAYTRSRDDDVVAIARRTIEAARESDRIDAAAEVVFTTGHVALAEVIARLPEPPSQPRLRALVYFLGGRFDRYEEVDFDGTLLRAIHGAAGEWLRRTLAECASRAGRLDWVRAVAGERARRHRALTRVEWEMAADLLASHDQWDEALRLAAAAPATWVAPKMSAWPLPPAESHLAGLAAAAHASPLPAATRFGDTPRNTLNAGGNVHSLAVTTSDTVYTGGADTPVRRCDLPALSATSFLVPAVNDVLAMAVSPDQRLLVTGDQNGRLRIWKLPGGELQGPLIGHTKRIIAIAISPDGKTIATGGHDRIIRLWNTHSRSLITTIDPDPVWTASLAITPDGSTLISGGALGNLRLWRLPGGTHLKRLTGHTSHIAAMAVSPDGTLLATGSYDHTIRLWRLPSGKPAGVLRGHTRHILTMAITPDGTLLASAGKDRVIRLWHLPSGEPAGELRGHTWQVECLRISPDGLLLASGAPLGSLIWWTRRDNQIGDLTERRLEDITLGRIDQLKRKASSFSPDEKAWFELVEAFVRWRGRHDIEVTDTAPAAGETWDIEAGDDIDGTMPPPARRKSRKRGKKRR
ncbi:WD40 repeat domain-containing protein [Actinoplanes sp. NPDC089786]|uniref:WD40 repeat domain-containing protein n=1 Tax=Actinoplanes sp. NPDC089786 TaxID=3155185 RepID=UPI003444292E